MTCDAFCETLKRESGLGEFYGRKAYRAIMAFDGLDDLRAYRDDEERLRVAEKLSPFLAIRHPGTRGFASPGALKFSSILHDGETIESVILGNKTGRTSLCVSVQAGCRMGCAFCATGASGLRRDLEASEIAGQALSARRDFGARPESIVLMGMGEPLDNYDASLAALRALTDHRGAGMAMKKMTISTSGIVPGIERLASEPPPRPNLALSLHAADDALRSSLMPVASAYPLARLREALERYARSTGQGIFVEYLLLAGVNDSIAQARALAEYLKRLPAKVNLMEYNDSGNGRFEASSPEAAAAFKRALMDCGLFVHSRRPKGAGARAACGQLASPRA